MGLKALRITRNATSKKKEKENDKKNVENPAAMADVTSHIHHDGRAFNLNYGLAPQKNQWAWFPCKSARATITGRNKYGLSSQYNEYLRHSCR